MIILYILIFISIVIILGSIVPIIQYFYSKYKLSQKTNDVNNFDYRFSLKLFDWEFKEEVDSGFLKITSRRKAANRGWVRGETTFDDKNYEKMREEEFSIELP